MIPDSKTYTIVSILERTVQKIFLLQEIPVIYLIRKYYPNWLMTTKLKNKIKIYFVFVFKFT